MQEFNYLEAVLSDLGKGKVILSSLAGISSTDLAPNSLNLLKTPSTSISGADAPAVTPTTLSWVNHWGSMSSGPGIK